jgi:hypothetical protein
MTFGKNMEMTLYFRRKQRAIPQPGDVTWHRLSPIASLGLTLKAKFVSGFFY